MHQGTSLNFGIKGFGDSISGQWFSGNASIVSVEGLSGKAEAIRAGQTHVNFKSSSLQLSIQVTVLETNTVLVEPPKEVLTNVLFPLKGYTFSVNFSDAYMDLHEAVGNNILSLLSVQSTLPTLGFLSHGRILTLIICIACSSLILQNIWHDQLPMWEIPDIIHQFLSELHSKETIVFLVLHPASAVFVGGFTVLEMDQHSLDLNMTHDSNKRIINIIGNTDIEINWRDRDRLAIRPTREGGDAGEGKHVRYEVKVLGVESFEDQIILSLPATGQRIEINVSFEAEERKAVVKTAAVTSC